MYKRYRNIIIIYFPSALKTQRAFENIHDKLNEMKD
jgi:hypothetical protein